MMGAHAMQRCWMQVDEHTNLGALPADAMPGFDGSKRDGRAEAEQLRARLDGLQQRLLAERRRSVLVVLQSMDAGGKDGAVRKVFAGVNPKGVQVASFSAPTDRELAQDFLWRVHRKTPAAGQIGVFVRSHYEDVVTARVRGTITEDVWRPRYEQIRAFEDLLCSAGTRILKFYLHIDRDEQRARFLRRLHDQNKQWKFDPADLEDRTRWDDYMRAYRDAIVQTDRPHAPWYVIAANRKWLRDLAMLRILVATLEVMDPRFPAAVIDPATVTVP